MRIGILLSLALVFAPGLDAQFQFRYNSSERTWTLQNGTIRAVFRLSPEATFEFRSLALLESGDVWEAPPGIRVSPVWLKLADEQVDEHTRFRLVRQSTRAIARRGYRQTIVLDDERGLGRVTLALEMFAGQPVLRYQMTFQNSQTTAVRVIGADMLPWVFHDRGKTHRVFRVNQWVAAGKLGNFEPLTSILSPGGQAVQIRAGAHGQHCAWLALRDDDDQGLFAGLEFDGRSTVSVRHSGRDRYLQLSGEIQGLSRTVAPGETFAVPPAFVGLCRGDWDDAGYGTQRFAEAAIAQSSPDERFPYVMWDSWKYQTELSEATLRRNADIAARLGIEVFVVDLGWSRHIGDWRHDPRKFPSGMRALSDYVRSLGMKFGLHFALAEAHEDSPVLRANPNWTSSDSYGYFDAESLCLGHRPVRDWIVAEAVRMIDDYRVDWILQDGENMVKNCTKSNHTHDPRDSNYSNAVDGLNTVVMEVQRQRPNTHWENCEDGGNMMTFNMVRNYVTSIAADDSGPMTTRQAIFGITYPFPPRYADRYMPDEELDKYITRSYMFGGPWIFMNRLPLMRPEDMELAASEIKLYKQIRTHVRDGRVFHLTSRPAENRIDALQSHNDATGSSLVFAYRADAPANYRVLRLRGVNPETTYQVRFQEDRRILTMDGRQLMDSGLRVNLPSRWFAEIAYIDPVK